MAKHQPKKETKHQPQQNTSAKEGNAFCAFCGQKTIE
jgi:hypothetical protein